MITILYFASLKEKLGVAREKIDLPNEVNTIGLLADWLNRRGEKWSTAFNEEKNLKVALNQMMSGMDSTIKDGDEIAFFPPVTGG